MGELIDGAMQQAAQWGRQFMRPFSGRPFSVREDCLNGPDANG
jgi:hypothetical protein